MEDEETIIDVALSVLMIVTFISLIIGATALIYSVVSSDTKTHNSTVVVDRECQYPGRLTNTPEACDNSDPCDPETLDDPKLTGACRDSLPTEPAAQPAPIEEPQTLTPMEGK